MVFNEGWVVIALLSFGVVSSSLVTLADSRVGLRVGDTLIFLGLACEVGAICVDLGSRTVIGDIGAAIGGLLLAGAVAGYLMTRYAATRRHTRPESSAIHHCRSQLIQGADYDWFDPLHSHWRTWLDYNIKIRPTDSQLSIEVWAWGYYAAIFPPLWPMNSHLTCEWAIDVLCRDKDRRCLINYTNTKSSAEEADEGDLRIRIVPNASAYGDTLTVRPTIAVALDCDSLSVSPATPGGWATISFGRAKEHVSKPMPLYEWDCRPEEQHTEDHGGAHRPG